jgi:hypothetical protein
MPCPKWKLVVDIGDVEEHVHVPLTAGSTSHGSNTAQLQHGLQADLKDAGDFALLAADPEEGAPLSKVLDIPTDLRDARADEVVALLAEFMPSDMHSAAANYLSGFMSLRLLLLRELRSPDEEQLVRTILESFTSYLASDRERSDIAIMLARDYTFLAQQQHQHFINAMSHGMFVPGATIHAGDFSGLSLFGLPSTNSSLQNSPALTPIPAPGLIDSMSIVST